MVVVRKVFESSTCTRKKGKYIELTFFNVEQFRLCEKMLSS